MITAYIGPEGETKVDVDYITESASAGNADFGWVDTEITIGDITYSGTTELVAQSLIDSIMPQQWDIIHDIIATE